MHWFSCWPSAYRCWEWFFRFCKFSSRPCRPSCWCSGNHAHVSWLSDEYYFETIEHGNSVCLGNCLKFSGFLDTNQSINQSITSLVLPCPLYSTCFILQLLHDNLPAELRNIEKMLKLLISDFGGVLGKETNWRERQLAQLCQAQPRAPALHSAYNHNWSAVHHTFKLISQDQDDDLKDVAFSKKELLETLALELSALDSENTAKTELLRNILPPPVVALLLAGDKAIFSWLPKLFFAGCKSFGMKTIGV